VNTTSFTFDVLSGRISVEYIANKIVINEPERSTRNPKFLKETHHRTDYGQNEPFNKCCVSFNKFSQYYIPGGSKISFLNAVKRNLNQ